MEKIKNIRLVVTGTCLQEGLDKKLVNWAKLNNIKSISCVDHWTLLKDRFKIKKIPISRLYCFE